MRYDESDHLIVRASRSVTDKFGDAFGMKLKHNDLCKCDLTSPSVPTYNPFSYSL